MAKLMEYLQLWLESEECPVKDSFTVRTTDVNRRQRPNPEDITREVVDDFIKFCDKYALEDPPEGAPEQVINAYKDYLKELNLPDHCDSNGLSEWFWKVATNESAQIYVFATWDKKEERCTHHRYCDCDDCPYHPF